MRRCLVATLLLLFIVHSAKSQQPLSPWDFGLRDAASDSARFWVLWNTHHEAVAEGTTVTYKGIDTLDIEIPTDAKSIPLVHYNDFGNVVIRVKSTTKGLFLFSLCPPMEQIEGHNDTLCHAIDGGDFSTLGISDSYWLVEVTDSTPWVRNREDHTYGHYRKELLRVRGLRSSDTPVLPYQGTASRPVIRGRRIEEEKVFFGNITLLRDSASTARVYLTDIENCVGVTMKNVTVVTPESTLNDDCIIKIYNCADVWIDSVTLMGSYSHKDHSGYGLLMDNLRDTRVSHLFARSEWGIFGTNNMCNTTMEDCDFDRFDIHCYGRDVAFKNCRQQNSYNQFSSVVGNISFDNCRFDNFTPVLIEDSYNAYTHFTLSMKRCDWHLTEDNHTLMKAGRINPAMAGREELDNNVSLPDVEIDSITLGYDKEVRELMLFQYTGRKQNAPIAGIQHIILHNVIFEGAKPLDIEIANKKVLLHNMIQVEIPSKKGLIVKKNINKF